MDAESASKSAEIPSIYLGLTFIFLKIIKQFIYKVRQIGVFILSQEWDEAKKTHEIECSH